MSNQLPPKLPPQFLKDELLSSESIVWWGQPTLKASVLGDTFKFIISGLSLLAYCGAHPFNFSLQFSVGAPLSVPFSLLDAIPVFGVIWLITLPIQSLLRGKKTFYLITNKRALIVTRGAFVHAAPLFLLADLHISHAAGFASFEWTLPSNSIDEDNSVRRNSFVFYGVDPAEEKLLEVRLLNTSAS